MSSVYVKTFFVLIFDELFFIVFICGDSLFCFKNISIVFKHPINFIDFLDVFVY
jgi:hypothetical protein